MNRIYKVIWSKVKHQYVVVSELAHSNGKQSRTAKRSLRSRIAALVVCGAIAAFGVFGMMEQQAFAADIEYDREVVTAEEGVAQATNGQYVAIKTTETNSNKTATFTDADNKSYSYHLEKLDGVGNYWVRDGYSISAITGENAKYYPGADKDVRIITHKNGAVESVDAGLLKTGQVMIEGSKNADGDFITTYTGSVLNDVTAGTYVGVTNEGGTQTPGDWNYIIKDSNGEFVDVNAEGSTAKFIEAEKQADGTYTVNGQPVSTDNLYVIGDVTYTEKGYGPWKETIRNINYRLGAFLTTAGEVYKGKVFGKNNEVLMTKKESDGTYYSYWSALSNDPDEALNLTVDKFNTGIKAVDDNSRMLAEYDIDRIDVRANDENSGGQIGLLRRGKYNTDTGKWEGEYYTPGSITVENTGGENGSGDDLKIKFSNSDEEGAVHSFDVEAGSKVEASEVSNGKVTQLKINGEAYNIGGGSSVTSGYVNSEGDVYIKQDGDAPDSKGILIGRIKVTGKDGIDVTPSVEDGGKTLKYTVSGAGLADTNLSNLTEVGKTEIKSLEKHIAPGEYEIEDGKVTMTYEDGNGNPVEGAAVIKDVASQTYVSNYITENAGDIIAGANNLSVEKDPNGGTDGGNWTITDSQGETPLTLTNTTLEAGEATTEETNNGYGNTYTIKDTDGNEVTLSNVA
ncbi:ESPR domain-containing protein, partial [Megamonas sp.]